MPYPDVARARKCSAVYLNRCFRNHTGETLLQHLIDHRIRTAKELLRHGQMTPKEVAFACGYASLNYFCRQFRQQTGMMVRLWQEQALAD